MVVLCVALGKLVAWNLWTGEARECRRKELLCGAYLRDIRVLPMRKAGVTGHKMGCKAKAGRMGILRDCRFINQRRDDGEYGT